MTDVTLGNVILSYPNLWTPKAAKGSDNPKFSATFILPADFDKTDLKAAVEEAKVAKWGTNIPQNLKSQIKKVDGGIYDGYWCVTSNTSPEYPPQVVDANVNPILDKTQIFAGCTVNVSLGVFGYDVASKGVAFGLNHVQLVSNVNVTRLDGSKQAKDVFKKIEGAPPPVAEVGEEGSF